MTQLHESIRELVTQCLTMSQVNMCNNEETVQRLQTWINLYMSDCWYTDMFFARALTGFGMS